MHKTEAVKQEQNNPNSIQSLETAESGRVWRTRLKAERAVNPTFSARCKKKTVQWRQSETVVDKKSKLDQELKWLLVMRHNYQNTINTQYITLLNVCLCARAFAEAELVIFRDSLWFQENGHVAFTSVCELVLVLTLLNRLFFFDLELKIIA